MLPTLRDLVDHQKETGCPHFKVLLTEHQQELGQIAMQIVEHQNALAQIAALLLGDSAISPEVYSRDAADSKQLVNARSQ